MNLFCNGCEYLSDNPDLMESCVHKKFCEKAFEKGCLSAELFKQLDVVDTNNHPVILFTYDINNSTISKDHFKNLCASITEWLKPFHCLYVPVNTLTYSEGDFVCTTVKNKFYYNEDKWALTSEEGNTFTNTVSDAIEELFGKPICAYNEFIVVVHKTKDDYRNFDIQGSTEPETNS